MAVAETIKPSSSRKHLAASFRLVRGGEGWGGECRRGPLARQRRQHACLSECAIAQCIALRCQITLEWTAATSTSTPPVCHDATIHVSHCVWNADPEMVGGVVEERRREEGEQGNNQQRKSTQETRQDEDKGEETQSSPLSYAVDSNDTFLLFLPSLYTRDHQVHYHTTPRQNPSAFIHHIRQISKTFLFLPYILMSFSWAGPTSHWTTPIPQNQEAAKETIWNLSWDAALEIKGN